MTKSRSGSKRASSDPNDLIGHDLFDLLPLPVSRVETLGDQRRGGVVFGQEQIESLPGILEPTRRVQRGASRKPTS
jgi:hypothetical protein